MKETVTVILASDIHLCHIDWYGMQNESRVDKFFSDIRARYEQEPFDALLLLGDYSLDYWAWEIKGCFLNEGKSYSELFAIKLRQALGDLPIKISMIAGNHEQFGEEAWNRITGFSREDVYINGDTVFLLLDTFAGNLDPTEHSDGTYTGANVAKIKEYLQRYSEKRFVLCAHHFDPQRESEEFRRLLRDEERIICLFGGHVHRSCALPLGEEYGNKTLIYTGNYSYSAERPITRSMWGYREVVLSPTELSTRYVTPENRIVTDQGEILHRSGVRDEITLSLPPNQKPEVK
ncbi:MAG: metallophosphoesterase [Clostridia bacterium]|nr:metallophosphoesterase [Clostridia bacterium]